MMHQTNCSAHVTELLFLPSRTWEKTFLSLSFFFAGGQICAHVSRNISRQTERLLNVFFFFSYLHHVCGGFSGDSFADLQILVRGFPCRGIFPSSFCGQFKMSQRNVNLTSVDNLAEYNKSAFLPSLLLADFHLYLLCREMKIRPRFSRNFFPGENMNEMFSRLFAPQTST